MGNPLKGPWALCYDGVIEDAEGGTVIGFPFDSYREFNEQSDFDKAKQRAIAAAPELLASLIEMLAEAEGWLDDSRGCKPDGLMEHGAFDRAYAIIAKATGGAA